jgi:hypothetical protein
MTETARSADAGRELARQLTEEYAALPAESVLRCVLDAAEAVDYFGVDASVRADLLERVARSHLDALVTAYDENRAARETVGDG